MPEVFENYMASQFAYPENQECFSQLHELQPMSNSTSYSPYSDSANSQEARSIASPMSTSLSPLHGTDYLNNATILGEPHLTIVEQPQDKFRFRYKSEMIGTHGSLVGANSGVNRRKHAPTVQLHNFHEKAVIRCTLVASDDSQRIPHAHRLVRREGGQDKDDPHHVTVSPETGFLASFHGMGIIHTARKHIRDELIRKMRKEALERKKTKNLNATLSTRDEAQIRAEAECYQKCVNLNSVALCFQAFILDHNDIMVPITEPVFSTTINNLKSALTGELKICRIDKHTSSCEGGEEVFILVEKVGKKNIKIKFFEVNEDDCEVWSAYGRFTELDVHHQYAIAFRTPPYKDLTITSPKEVYIQLERPSDSDCSEPIKFTYKPSDRLMGRKRQRMSYTSSAELSNIMLTYNATTPEDTSLLLSNDSRELSKEIKKMLSDGCSSADLLDFVSNSDFKQYVELMGNSDEDMLTSDGPSNKQRHEDDALFARTTLIEAINCMQVDPKNMKERLKTLLKDRSTYGDTPLHSALRYGQRNVVKYILMLISTNKECKALVNGQNSSGKTPLHYAVLQNQPDIAKALLLLGADPNRSDEHGFSSLHAAARIPDAGACVDVLLSEKMTDIEAHNDAGWTALHLAAEAGSYHAVCSLVRAGANVNNTDMSYGRTTLHIAVEGGHKKIVEFLLKQTKVQVNKRNFSGNTALHSAVVHSGVRAKELCSLLIRHGADPHLQNHNRESNNVDKRRQHVGVKVEIESEDENAEGNVGQSSFDLASNKPDILQLLTGEVDSVNKIPMTSMKQESPEEDSQTVWLSAEQKQRLSELLDKTAGWKKLAKQLNLEYLLRTFEKCSSSPSLLLLNSIDVQGSVPLAEMGIALSDIGEKKAADYITEILSTRTQNASAFF